MAETSNDLVSYLAIIIALITLCISIYTKFQIRRMEELKKEIVEIVEFWEERHK